MTNKDCDEDQLQICRLRTPIHQILYIFVIQLTIIFYSTKTNLIGLKLIYLIRNIFFAANFSYQLNLFYFVSLQIVQKF